MKIRSLSMQNFRQFMDSHTIDFSTDDVRNITVLWGANGAGKTTLLNAFTWGLYGSFTPDFEHPDRLVNETTWANLDRGDRVRVAVHIEFEHEDFVYQLARHSDYEKQPDGSQLAVTQDEAHLSYTDQAGRNHRSHNPNDAIRRIIPDRLHQFFFFNGERIEHLVQPSAYEEIGEAIRTVLGLEAVDRALRHIPQARKKLEDELRQFGSEEERDLAESIDRVEQSMAGLREQLDQAKRNAAAAEEERDRIDLVLRQTAGARELQNRRDSLLAEEKRNDELLAGIAGKIDQLIRDEGFLTMAGGLLESARREFAERRTKGEIPTPIKRDFIEDLLERGECICGTELATGSKPYECLEEWRSRAGLVEVDEAWHTMFAAAGSLLERRSQMRGKLAELLEDDARARENRSRLTSALSEVSVQLGSNEVEDVRDLEGRRARVESELNAANREQGRIEQQIDESQGELSDYHRRLKSAQSRTEKADLARRRVSTAQDAVDLLEKVYELRTHDVRLDLDSRIRSVYESITYKPYRPVLNEDFQLQLFYENGDPVAKSTGENQILSLSFVGALASLARQRYEESKGAQGLAAVSGSAGGVFPIVMDAAFGTLDDGYRREVSKGLPELAPQVIVLVSKSQGLGPVEEEMRHRIGQMHVIHYRTPKEDATEEYIELGGTRYPYIEPSDDNVERAEMVAL